MKKLQALFCALLVCTLLLSGLPLSGLLLPGRTAVVPLPTWESIRPSAFNSL